MEGTAPTWNLNLNLACACSHSLSVLSVFFLLALESVCLSVCSSLNECIIDYLQTYLGTCILGRQSGQVVDGPADQVDQVKTKRTVSLLGESQAALLLRRYCEISRRGPPQVDRAGQGSTVGAVHAIAH